MRRSRRDTPYRERRKGLEISCWSPPLQVGFQKVGNSWSTCWGEEKIPFKIVGDANSLNPAQWNCTGEGAFRRPHFRNEGKWVGRAMQAQRTSGAGGFRQSSTAATGTDGFLVPPFAALLLSGSLQDLHFADRDVAGYWRQVNCVIRLTR
jgi:hypothetical protein